MAAGKREVLVMTHPDLPGREITALDQHQARVFAASGWVLKGSTSKRKKKTDNADDKE